jgi:hypothetical protein
MIYFDSDMSKSTNTVVYFDWKTSYKNVASKSFFKSKIHLCVPNDINDHGNEMKCDTQIKGWKFN